MKSIETISDTCKEVGLEVNAEKTKYMLLSRHQDEKRNRDIKIANRYFENVAQLRYLGKVVRNQNLIKEEIKRRLNSANTCYHSVQSVWSPHLLFKNLILKCTKLLFFLWFCMTVKLGL
jgi:hypothetical protein